MNISAIVAVFPIIFLGELPDKTMFASLVLATKGRPGAVWIGTAAAFVVHVAIAVTFGVVLFHLLPHRVVNAAVSGMFFLGALLAIMEMREEPELERSEEALIEAELRSHRQTLVASFVVIFLAEWGDLTQILTVNLAAKYHNPVSVGFGAILALWTVAGIAVFSGRTISRFVNTRIVHLVTAVVLTILTILTAVIAAR